MEYIDLEVWKESRKLVKMVYEATKSFPKEEIYGLTNQLRRSSCSIPSNIAEGCGRKTPNDTIRFLHISRGSLYELETQLYLSLDQNYLSEKEFDMIISQIVLCKKLLNGFVNYYNTIG
ncbi:four helix bundle protein [Flagellimonas aequoris]|uniref:Four helix bundle protein n=1 Tax=Flagellimonas aequoris TaxID=2306997 RepID=A0A418NCH7_9FLAO|nr:four helix bundle protein [Allomuricauda aequoris]RIV73920.1 four helix bundle protein [Allomuricauda aequoris]TXK07608.1 four helix bundle protein [Allomuricauda aequoris]